MAVRRTMSDKNIYVVGDDRPTAGTVSGTRTRILEGAIAVLWSERAAKDFKCATAHLNVVVSGKERAFREPGLALSSQPTDQQKETSGTLAVRSNGVASITQSPRTSSAPLQSYMKSFTLTPIIPRQIKRSGRKDLQGEYAVYKVPKGPLDFPKDLASVSGWQPLTHPEGALFFYHSDYRVFTDVNVRVDEIAVKMGKIAEKAYEEAHKADVFDPSVELALERMEVDGKETWGYYFADHHRRVVFWSEPHESVHLMGNVRGVNHESHNHSTGPYGLRILLHPTHHDLNRRHVELFPNKRFLPEDVVVRLKGIVMYTQADSITSEQCLTSFTLDQVASILGLMDPLMSSINKEHEHSVWIVARFMRQFCQENFVNFCGQPGARLNADQSLYGDSSPHLKKILFRVMNIVLFGSPDAYSKAIHNVWVDYTIVQRRWKNFINRLNSEWNGYTIFSTVMLAVDISFFAVQSVQTQPPVMIVSYMSTLCAMGSLVVSLILAGQVSDSRRDSAQSVASFMLEMSGSMLGVETLAVMLSLPFAGHAQSAVCSPDLGNGILCYSIAHPDCPYFWHRHHLYCISHVARYGYSGGVAGTGCQWFPHFSPDVLGHQKDGAF
ncbi:hypothetical protein DFH29DRAFT_1001648 [Suillus ampliporus]|nr:hypothetical protein DFH29DRAFT_1001648 [Suillus ampliporus]